jgi:hypothetical protein
MRLIHLQCLRTWLCRKENIKAAGPSVVSYSWRAYHCDLCKSEISDRVVVEGRTLNVVDIQRPATNYMILESI